MSEVTIIDQAVATLQPPPGAPASAWAILISACWQTSVKAILEVGRLLTEAKQALPHGAFGAMIEADLPFAARTAQMLMAISADPRITNPKHVSHLPAAWGTLYEITKLTDEQFDRGIAEKTIRPDMERREAINGARAIMGSRAEPDDSLDYFPTPPWATRALMERVLPAHGIKMRGAIREPACGEGHIAEVLREYCPDVYASDIFDYGYADEVVDYLKTDLNFGSDWVVTNPPFGDAALDFVELALSQARIGVAMFFRSQWAVEGVERFTRLFKNRPPTVCAFFVERVNLCKGRWDPDGSTATAYCWLVWHHGAQPRPTFWIPPGCRETLTRSDDAKRFTQNPVIKKPLDIPEFLRPPVDIRPPYDRPAP